MSTIRPRNSQCLLVQEEIRSGQLGWMPLTRQPWQKESSTLGVFFELSAELVSQQRFLLPCFDRPNDKRNRQSQQSAPFALRQRCACKSEEQTRVDRMAQARIRPGANEGMTGADRNRRAPICAKVRTRPDRQRHSTRRYMIPIQIPVCEFGRNLLSRGPKCARLSRRRNARDDHRR